MQDALIVIIYLAAIVYLVTKIYETVIGKKAAINVVLNNLKIKGAKEMTVNIPIERDAELTLDCIDVEGGAAKIEDGTLVVGVEEPFLAIASVISVEDYTDGLGQVGSRIKLAVQTLAKGITNLKAIFDGHVGEGVVPIEVNIGLDIGELDAAGANISFVLTPKIGA